MNLEIQLYLPPSTAGFVVLGTERVNFTPTEFKILSLLYENPQAIIPRDEMIKYTWGREKVYHFDDPLLRTHMSYTRRKVQRPKLGIDIVSARYYGTYLWDPMGKLKIAYYQIGSVDPNEGLLIP